jgi:hypothetical protein
MYDFASGPGASASLLGGSEPPLSPEMVGSSPSFLEAPIPLKPIPSVTSTTTLPAPTPLPDPPATAAAFSPPALVEALPVETTAARLVVRMLGGDELELGVFDDRDDAIEAAKELVASFSSAEQSGDWPELNGRFLRPASVASIDVLVAS